MNRVQAVSRARGQRVTIDLCPRCRREVLPAELKGAGWHRDTLRAPAEGMVKTEPELDPRAEKIRERRRKKELAALRAANRTDGIAGAAKLFISTRGYTEPALDEDCPECKGRRQRREGRAA